MSSFEAFNETKESIISEINDVLNAIDLEPFKWLGYSLSLQANEVCNFLLDHPKIKSGMFLDWCKRVYQNTYYRALKHRNLIEIQDKTSHQSNQVYFMPSQPWWINLHPLDEYKDKTLEERRFMLFEEFYYLETNQQLFDFESDFYHNRLQQLTRLEEAFTGEEEEIDELLQLFQLDTFLEKPLTKLFNQFVQTTLQDLNEMYEEVEQLEQNQLDSFRYHLSTTFNLNY